MAPFYNTISNFYIWPTQKCVINSQMVSGNQSTSTNSVSFWSVALIYAGYCNSVSIVHAEPIINIKAEPLETNMISWPTLGQWNYYASQSPPFQIYRPNSYCLAFHGVSGGGGAGAWWWSAMIPRENPSGLRAIVYPESSILSRAWQATFSDSRSGLPGCKCVCLCVSVFGWITLNYSVLYSLVQPLPGIDHSKLQVWWSFPRSRHPKPSPRFPVLFLTCCQRVLWYVLSHIKATGDTPCQESMLMIA